MTEEQKKLLFTDLSSRLIHGVIIKCNDNLQSRSTEWLVNMSATEDLTVNNDFWLIDEVKPYLRPMSDMTDEEEKEYNILCSYPNTPANAALLINWLNEHKFDYRGLIEMELALKAKSKMYNI